MTRTVETQRPLFMIGQDSGGNWVVQDQAAIRGGLFVDCDAALRFVRSEGGSQRQVVIMISGILELDMTDRPGASSCRRPITELRHMRTA